MSKPPTPQTRRVLGVHFVPCGSYGHLRPDADGAGYKGRCPRCGHHVSVRTGPEGARVNFLQVHCPRR